MTGDQLGEVGLGHELLSRPRRRSRRRRPRPGRPWNSRSRRVLRLPRRPASSAGPPGTTSEISDAGRRVDVELLGELRVERLAGDADVGVLDLAVLAQLLERALDEVTGIAKPTPSLPPEVVSICWLIPITRPSASSSGPPELPGLIEASVWIAPSILNWVSEWIERSVAETIPTDSDCSSPNGLPIARDRLADRVLVGVAELERCSGRGPSGVDLDQGDVGVRIEADDLGRQPVAVARTRRRPRRPRDAVAAGLWPSVTTWALVTISPSSLITKPEPWPAAAGSAGVADERDDRDDARRGLPVDRPGDRSRSSRRACRIGGGASSWSWSSPPRRGARRFVVAAGGEPAAQQREQQRRRPGAEPGRTRRRRPHAGASWTRRGPMRAAPAGGRIRVKVAP